VVVLRVKMRLASTIEPADIPTSIRLVCHLNGGRGYVVSMAVGVGHVPMMQVLLYVGFIIGFFRGGFVGRTSESRVS